jgi:DNA polymerase-3 subunit delta
LVLLIHDEKKWKNGQMVWVSVAEGHWLRKALKESKKKIGWVEAVLPTQREMPDWIMKEAQKQGAKIEGSAAAELANLVGSDLFQARQEIDKAFSYCGKEQAITRDVVRLLCSQSREEDIFDMVDAAGQRDSRKALFLLRELMKDQPIQFIFVMLVRQVRLLIMTKEVLEAGGSERDVISTCGMASFVARKIISQSRQFKMEELENIFQKLNKMDEDSKTGHATLDVEIEMLVAKLSR